MIEWTEDSFYQEIEKNNLGFDRLINPVDSSAATSLFSCKDNFWQPHFKVGVEIGTYKGVSALILASWGLEKLYTFDIEHHPEAKPLWARYGADKIVERKIIKDRWQIARSLRDKDFDFAFIDSDHTYNNAKEDFKLVKRCGYVLFHDYNEEKFPGIVMFCDLIGAKKVGFDIAGWNIDD